MKIKQIAAFTTIFIFLLFLAGKCMYLYIQAQKDIHRLVRNDVNIRAQLTYYIDKQGRTAARNNVLEYSNKELKQIMPEVKQIITDLRIKPKRVESFSEVAVIQDKQITVPVKDSSIKKKDSIVHGKYFQYTDNWYDVKGWIVRDTMNLKICSTDTIIQIVSRGERTNKWLWFFSPRQLVQTIQSRNPSNKIVYSRYIKIKE